MIALDRDSEGRGPLGLLAFAGGLLGLLLAPILVVVKYKTGWAVIPEPFWVDGAERVFGALFAFAPPTELWTFYGSLYTLALSAMLAALLALSRRLLAGVGRGGAIGFRLLVVGLCLVIPGDAIHSWTWHQNGLTIPTPGTNPLANNAYAVHMMGMNLVMLGSTVFGIAALRRKRLASWLAWSFALLFPAALLASITFLPTTPSGALWSLSATLALCGYVVITGRADRLAATEKLTISKMNQ